MGGKTSNVGLGRVIAHSAVQSRHDEMGQNSCDQNRHHTVEITVGEITNLGNENYKCKK